MSGAFGEFAFGDSPFGGPPVAQLPPPGGSTPGGIVMTGGSVTTITPLTGAQFAQRMAALFPRGWASDDAKQSGYVYAFLLSLGNELGFVQDEIEYALLAQRIQTETFPELDLASVDFLGGLYPRPSGKTDADYAAAIIAQLFQSADTRAALASGLQALTGFPPRMMEPWSVNDTGAWGGISYWNVDTVPNPARWGNAGLRYQGFIETVPPSIPAIGPNNPVYGWTTQAYWNQPGYFFGIIAPVAENAIENLLLKLKAEGTEIWLKLVTPTSIGGIAAVVPGVATNVAVVSAGPTSMAVSWGVPATGSPPYTFTVLYRLNGTQNYSAAPPVLITTATVGNLLSGRLYDFVVLTRNSAGSSQTAPITVETNVVPPSPAQNLVATQVQAYAVTLGWDPPATGTPPFTYSVNWRVTGTVPWNSVVVGVDAFAVTIIGLQPLTTYDFEVVSTN